MSKELTILVADCDTMSFFIVQKYFGLCNIKAKWKHAKTANATLEYFIKYPAPELVIIDPFMPDMPAYDFLANMNSQEIFDASCVCLLSVMPLSELHNFGLRFNICKTYPKPITKFFVVEMMKGAKDIYD